MQDLVGIDVADPGDPCWSSRTASGPCWSGACDPRRSARGRTVRRSGRRRATRARAARRRRCRDRTPPLHRTYGGRRTTLVRLVRRASQCTWVCAARRAPAASSTWPLIRGGSSRRRLVSSGSSRYFPRRSAVDHRYRSARRSGPRVTSDERRVPGRPRPRTIRRPTRWGGQPSSNRFDLGELGHYSSGIRHQSNMMSLHARHLLGGLLRAARYPSPSTSPSTMTAATNVLRMVGARRGRPRTWAPLAPPAPPVPGAASCCPSDRAPRSSREPEPTSRSTIAWDAAAPAVEVDSPQARPRTRRTGSTASSEPPRPTRPRPSRMLSRGRSPGHVGQRQCVHHALAQVGELAFRRCRSNRR